MRVLLLSPLPGLDPANGDVTYTEILLGGPPAGVEYVDYAQALSEGSLVERYTRRDVRSRRASGRARALAEAGLNSGVNRLRRQEILFREPVRAFEVRPEAFDLVHSHVFSVRCLGGWPPLVLSNSVPVEALYRDGLRWGRRHVETAAGMEKLMARALDVAHTTYRQGSAQHLIGFTEHLAQWWVDQGVAERKDVSVVPCFVADRPLRPFRAVSRVVGLIANDPTVKGLDRALIMHQQVRRSRPDAELWVIGNDDVHLAQEARGPGVRWVGRVARDVLLDELLPQIDVMLHPTRFDGLPLSVLEAMAVGVPVVAAAYRALPEIVGLGGHVGDDHELVGAVLRLLEPETNAAVGRRAQERQRTHYSPSAVLPKLESAYQLALSARSRTSRR